SCSTLLARMPRIRSGAYHARSCARLVQGSCLYQSPSQRSFLGGLGISTCAKTEPLLSHFSRNRWPTVAQVMGMDSSSRIFTRKGTLLLQRVDRTVLSSTPRPRNAQAISKSAEIVADANAPPRNGVISTPSKHRRGGRSPGTKFPFKAKTDFRTDCFNWVIMKFEPEVNWLCFLRISRRLPAKQQRQLGRYRTHIEEAQHRQEECKQPGTTWDPRRDQLVHQIARPCLDYKLPAKQEAARSHNDGDTNAQQKIPDLVPTHGPE